MKLFHCSDIQIRPLTRHKEFKSVFKQFYKSLISNNAIEDSIIVVCGDILQEKDKLKPETIMIMRKFFKQLINISGCVVVIAGNHDLLENNKERLDNITPIVTDLEGLHYLKNTGEYLINGVNFVVNSIIDNGFVTDIKNNDKNIPNIGLFHGMLNGCTLDNGMIIKDRKISAKNFNGYDYVLLGDIHKHQYMNKEKTIAYCGSLVQQNFGEPFTGHGYIIWDLIKGSSKFIEIKSNYGFFNIRDIKDINFIDCQNAYIRYHVKEGTPKNDIELLKEKISEKCTVLREEIRYFYNDCEKVDNFDFIQKCQMNDIEVFKKFIDDKNLSKEKNIGLIEYHKSIKDKLEQTEGYGTNGYWTIDYLEFQNMLIYGGNHVNKIFFKNGVISICGNNAIGKSCILKLIIFALFDKTCSNDKNSIINKKANSCYIKLHFSFFGKNGKKYEVFRKGVNRNNKGKKEVRFNTNITENNKCINLEHEKKTMEELRRFLGGYEDFIMSNVFSHSYNDISLLKT
jgi:DNA repair exonuclease SbcCD nuclease subunit